MNRTDLHPTTGRACPSPGRLLPAAALALALAAGGAHALWQRDVVQAFRLPSGTQLVIDGKPEHVWKVLMGLSLEASIMRLNDYSKIVLLPDSLRNKDPRQHYQPIPPLEDYVAMAAAYDDANLYFFFLVHDTPFNGTTACNANDSWKANAPEVYVDYNPWSTGVYTTYFTRDASGLTFGTSKKTFQLAKPAHPGDTRKYYRDRTQTTDRFALRSPLPSGVNAVSAASPTDPELFGVEMKIPFPSGSQTAFANGSMLFASWGYNHYPGAAGTCSESPIAYRWAKHYRDYPATGQKPPGWQEGDSTHYDPVRSWDGWGRFDLHNRFIDPQHCADRITANEWAYDKVIAACREMAVPVLLRGPGRSVAEARRRTDALGRREAARPPRLLFPVLPAAAPAFPADK